MATKYAKHVRRDVTPQSEPIPGSSQVENSAGGFAWEVGIWAKLDRFLVLGTEGGSYYATERKMTKDSANAIHKCLSEDGPRVVRRTIEISEQGRAPKNDAALFVLALASSFGDTKTRSLAYSSLPRVTRIGTHLFTFLEYRKMLKGWGRGLRNAVANWYLNKELDQLAYQVVKYRNRGGWSHRDALRKAHPKADSPEKNDLLRWIVKYEKGEEVPPPSISLVEDYVQLQRAASAKEVVSLLNKNRSLSWEMIPSDYLKDPKVWDTLLPNLPMTALVRNLGRLTALEVLKPLSSNTKLVIEKLTNQEFLKKARIHPIAVLAAYNAYANGTSIRGSVRANALIWDPIPQIAQALDDAFYLAFGTITPTGKRWLLGIDVSGSMKVGTVSGIPGLTPNVAAAAMAMVSARTESQYHILGFCHELRNLNITAKDSIQEAMKKTQQMSFGGTDCAKPMIWAKKNKIEVDVFAIYTDSETWAGHIHPKQALDQYRQTMGIPAKEIVVGMVGNSFSIADPTDPGMLDVVGFDTAVPEAMSAFATM